VLYSREATCSGFTGFASHYLARNRFARFSDEDGAAGCLRDGALRVLAYNLTPYMAKKGYALVRKDQAEPGTSRIRGISPSASYNTFCG
jgi:hypothetical protein